jgi:AraC family transcriptional regulator
MPTHRERLQRAVDFVEERLADELSLEDIARRAGYSSWHFQRLFSGVVGEGLATYVRKRRLTEAFAALAETERPILDVALGCGFEGQAAFTRAFKRHFGVTPGACRKARGRVACPGSTRLPRLTPSYLDHLEGGGLSMEPRLVTLPEIHVVGLEAEFVSALASDTNNMAVVPRLWGRFLGRRRELTSTRGYTDFGLVYGAAPGRAKPHPEALRYLAGAEVPADAPVPQGMTRRVLPAGRYAKFVHRGSLARLPLTMRYIFSTWLPSASVELREAPDVEVYGEKFRPDDEASSELEILIPVQ